MGDRAKDFAESDYHFYWVVLNRLEARKCCADWLRKTADVWGGRSREHLLSAAQHYDRAHAHDEDYRRAVGAGEQAQRGEKRGLRSAEAIAVVLPHLQKGVAAERGATTEIGKALALLK